MAIKTIFLAAQSRVFALSLLLLTIFAVGCVDQNRTPAPTPTASVWTFNEGQFMQGNSSIIPYDPINKAASPSDLFSQANGGAVLGDVPSSAHYTGSALWVPISGSGKIYILDPVTGKLTDKITGLDSPRHVVMINSEKGYVSNLNKPELTIFNPTTKAITGSVVLETAGELFVSTSQGLFVNLWSYGKKIAKIDPTTDKVVSLIEVGIQPKKLVADKDENLWVLCDGGGWDGNPIGFEAPSISKLNPQATEVLRKWELPAGSFSFGLAPVDGGAAVLVLSGKIYKMASNATEFPATPFIQLPEGVTSFYSLDVDPESGDIYTSDAVDFTQRGMVYRYNKEGVLVDQYKAGVAPAFFYFQPKK